MNFAAVALALNELDYTAIGVRIDSGDLAYLSRCARDTFKNIAKYFDTPWFETMQIVASNDIDEDTILSLNDQGHSIDCFGIGTHLGMYFMDNKTHIFYVLTFIHNPSSIFPCVEF